MVRDLFFLVLLLSVGFLPVTVASVCRRFCSDVVVSFVVVAVLTVLDYDASRFFHGVLATVVVPAHCLGSYLPCSTSVFVGDCVELLVPFLHASQFCPGHCLLGLISCAVLLFFFSL